MKRVKEILKSSPDPLGVRETTAEVFEDMKFVEINPEKISEIAKVVKEKVEKKQVLDEGQFGSFEPTPQLIFILDTVNFCFWAGKDQEKWTVEYPKGNFISNGWFGLVAAIERAQKEGKPILEANYLRELTLGGARDIFRSSNDTEIPLLIERKKFLNEAGEILDKKYNGNIYNLLAGTGLDAGRVASQVVRDFSSFSDSSALEGKVVYFYKRAQIFAYDIALLNGIKAKNLEALTCFADYKIPQILRAFGVTKYKRDLGRVDNYEI
jgi:hypothetical protein